MENRKFVLFTTKTKKNDGTFFDKLTALYQREGETGKAYFDVKFKKETRVKFDAKLLADGLHYPVVVTVNKVSKEEFENGTKKHYFINEETKNGYKRKYICFLDFVDVCQSEYKPVSKDEDDYL